MAAIWCTWTIRAAQAEADQHTKALCCDGVGMYTSHANNISNISNICNISDHFDDLRLPDELFSQCGTEVRACSPPVD